jgi:hypothetical protein
MPTKKQMFLWLWVTLLLVHSPATFAVEITLGDESFQVAAPAGFADVSGVSKEQFAVFEDMLPESNRLLAVFVTEQDAGRLMRGDSADFREYFLVQSVKALESMTLSKQQFTEIRSMLRQQYGDVFEKQKEAIEEGTTRAGRSLSKRLGTDVDFNISGMVPLGIDEETASHISMSFLSKYDMTIDGDVIESVVAGTTTVLLVRGKVLYLNGYRTYKGEQDLGWTRSQVKSWLPHIVSLNEKIWPLADGQIVPQGTLVDSHTQDLITGEQFEYSLKGHTKAGGLDVSLKCPSSWRAEEGIRPHIVQKFTGEAFGGILPGCMIVVQDLPAWASLFLKDEIGAEALSESLREIIPPNATYLGGGKTQIDGEPGAWLKYHYQDERAGMRADMYSLMYILFYNGKMLAIQCNVGGVAGDKEIMEDAFASYLPLFQTIGNSVVIHDKWTKATNEGGTSIMEDVFGEYWWITLIISAILTWGIGLTPPLLIRFAFLRRPISKGWAIGTAAIFWFINIIFFTALGSTSKTHYALFLVAWASYAILRKGARKRQSMQLEPTSDPTLQSEVIQGNVEDFQDVDSEKLHQYSQSSLQPLLTQFLTQSTGSNAAASTEPKNIPSTHGTPNTSNLNAEGYKQEKRKKSWFAFIMVLLSIMCFIIMTPGSAHFWYKQGAGHAIGDLIDSGVDIEVATPKAKTFGIVYATLMVVGQHFSILILFLITVGILTRSMTKVIMKNLIFMFLFICLLGTTCLGLAQGMVQYNARWYSYLGSAFLIWMVIGSIFGIIIFVVSGCKRRDKRATETE